MASFFRNIDRNMNEDNYPQLHYPHVYILKGGFSEFSKVHSDHIVGEYVRMLDGRARSTGELVAANSAFKERIVRAKEELEGEKIGSSENCQSDPKLLSPKQMKRRRMTAA
jgi:hypothetical protein